MPPIRSKPKSTFLRHQLVETIIRTGSLVIRVCSNCERAGQADKYKVRVSSGRCVECARKGLSDYNLSPFSPVKWTRIWNQRNQKAAEAKEALAKFNRLQREVEVLEKKGIEMVEGELQNIEEVEQNERANAPDPSDFLFDVSSEQVEIPADFNWSGLVDAGGIATAGSGSSQGS